MTRESSVHLEDIVTAATHTFESFSSYTKTVDAVVRELLISSRVFEQGLGLLRQQERPLVTPIEREGIPL